MINTPKFREIFNRLKTSIADGVSGVLRIDSRKPGPVLGITACTHGNEPSGLAMFDYLLNKINIEKELRCGILYLAVNNMMAAESFFNAVTEEEIRKSRYCDVNMNRLPDDTLHLTNNTQYEISRAIELYPIWKHFEIGLDIHSTMDPSVPMIISKGEEFHPSLVRGFPIKDLISNIDRVQIGIPSLAFYGGLGSNSKVFAIETGQHSDMSSFKRATACAVSLLQNLGMLPSTQHPSDMEYNEYHVDDSIIFPDISFDFIKHFKPFDKIRHNDLLATNPKGEEIRAPFDGHLIMPTSLRGADKYILEEAAFVSRPVKKRKAE